VRRRNGIAGHVDLPEARHFHHGEAEGQARLKTGVKLVHLTVTGAGSKIPRHGSAGMRTCMMSAEVRSVQKAQSSAGEQPPAIAQAFSAPAEAPTTKSGRKLVCQRFPRLQPGRRRTCRPPRAPVRRA